MAWARNTPEDAGVGDGPGILQVLEGAALLVGDAEGRERGRVAAHELADRLGHRGAVHCRRLQRCLDLVHEILRRGRCDLTISRTQHAQRLC